MDSKVIAPFDDLTIELLEKYQSSNTMHPYTCGGDNIVECVGKRGEDTSLIPLKKGLVCPCGKYIQTWCHNHKI